MRFMLYAASLASLALVTACSPQSGAGTAPAAQARADVHPVSGLEIIPVTVTTGKGKHTFKTELAALPEDQGKGLMFRTKLGPDEAMLFPRDGSSQASFWMKNTPLSLDIIFIGPDRRISNIAANTVPYSLKSVTSDGVASAVLELRAGRAAELGITAGNSVAW